MSIFRETFPSFVQEELKRRQSGMAARTPAFLQQLNTRNAWVRMTSGVNYNGNNDLAKQYVLQGGTLIDGSDLRSGIGGGAAEGFASTYSNFTPGGATTRLGIRPMPGITNVSIQSKGAYGSLQEATISFVAWDIRQLEDLEVLYMRPGYTVLLEFGWNFAKNVNGVLPKFDILNIATGLNSINDAFAQIYDEIESSNGTYDALLGYVKNYSWVARNDGGYDCTTTIISLGEVLESLKCNWVPIETKAFSDNGVFNLDLPDFREKIKDSYELGIIPGLLHEMWGFLRSNTYSPAAKNFATTLKDPINGTKYQLCMSETMQGPAKFNRGGLPKPLGNVSQGTEAWITLGSFCDLLNNYVLLKDEKDNPLVQITTNETDSKGNISNTSLKCIANPLSISTNLGVCLIRNDNWLTIGLKENKNEEAEDKNSTPAVSAKTLPTDLQIAFTRRWFRNRPAAGITGNVAKRFKDNLIPSGGGFRYKGEKEGFQKDLDRLVNDILNVSEVTILKNNQAQIIVKGAGNTVYKFNSDVTETNKIDIFKYFYTTVDNEGTTLENNTERAKKVYRDFFESETIFWGENTKEDIIEIIERTFSSFNPYTNDEFAAKLRAQQPQVAENVNEVAQNTLITSGIFQFLVPETSLKKKTLGNISNIYVNINYLYSQAVSKNVASNDNQNTNNISIREYLQSILRDIQNSLGNINQFDIQVDERTAIGRIVDLNFTGNPDQELFELQIHNTNSVVRDYGFQSKIFPEMGSIIAISAQDPSGIGKLGYDNATLVAWNDGIRDRLIPKKTFNSKILIRSGEGSNEISPEAFVLSFLTKIVAYFKAIKGTDSNNANFLFGGLDFAYRDFLANLSRFDRRNDFKAIIPTTLDITLDGIGGMVIGNLFTINQDIIPRGYRSAPGRKLAYIVTKLGHNISNNDWTTELSAYPVIFEQTEGTNIADKWDNQQYSNSTTEITINGVPLARIPAGVNENNLKITVNFFLSKGYSDFQVAALVGGFLQESNVIPTAQNDKGAIGIAQWLKDRKQKLLAKSNPFSLNTQLNFVIEEFNGDEALAGRLLKKSTTLEEAIAAAAAYERFGGITIRDGVTFAEVATASERGDRIPLAETLLQRIRNGEFSAPKTPKTNQPSAQIIAQSIKNAVSGPDVTNFDLISSIKQIKNINTFKEVNKIVNIQNILNSELGVGDTNTAQTLKNYLNTIGVNLQFETEISGVNSIRITYK